MMKYIPTYTDISEWNLKIYTGTTGSRSKKIAIEPQSKNQFFFKGSKELDDGTLRYPSEFWSEIVASKIGQYLGFDVLDYNIALHSTSNQKVGCLSKSMVNVAESELTEGQVYLTGFDSKYNPKFDKEKYTFQFIQKTLIHFGLDHITSEIIKTIIFDSIIGNSDRHQENWGIITSYEETLKRYSEEIRNAQSWKNKLRLNIERLLAESVFFNKKLFQFLFKEDNIIIQSSLMENIFSPIYDSGCCLGREITDEKIAKNQNNENWLNSYIKRGKSEIHWESNYQGIKINHFELVRNLKPSFPSLIDDIINMVIMNYKSSEVNNLIQNIDSNLPNDLSEYKLSQDRKNLMIKLIDLRIKELEKIS